MSGTVAVRYGAGVVGESRRQAHLASAPDSGETPVTWATFCGLSIPAAAAEVSHVPDGMPCLPCMMRSAAFGGTAIGSGAR